jgi:hypothetical protein
VVLLVLTSGSPLQEFCNDSRESLALIKKARTITRASLFCLTILKTYSLSASLYLSNQAMILPIFLLRFEGLAAMP